MLLYVHLVERQIPRTAKTTLILGNRRRRYSTPRRGGYGRRQTEWDSGWGYADQHTEED